MKNVLCFAALAFSAGCTSPTTTTHHRTSSNDTLRPKPVRVAYASTRSAREPRLNYPRPGQFRSFGIVETQYVANVEQQGLPPIGAYDPSSEPAPPQAVEVRPFIGSTHNPPLGPQGTNRAVINQITGLPVDQ